MVSSLLIVPLPGTCKSPSWGLTGHCPPASGEDKHDPVTDMACDRSGIVCSAVRQCVAGSGQASRAPLRLLGSAVVLPGVADAVPGRSAHDHRYAGGTNRLVGRARKIGSAVCLPVLLTSAAYQCRATSSTTRGGLVNVVTWKGNRARTPMPNVTWPSKSPANTRRLNVSPPTAGSTNERSPAALCPCARMITCSLATPGTAIT